MPYIGRDIRTGAFRQLDDISSGFDGSDTTHTMQVNSTNVSVGDVNQILLSLGGVIQKPGTDFTVSGSTLTFTTAPAANTSFFAILLGSDNGGTVTPTDGSVTTSKFASGVAIGATGTANTLAGIPFFSDSSNKSMYTHDVSGTDSTAAGNTAFGFTAMDAITTGDDNTAFGENALGGLQDGTENVAIGKNSMLAATSASQNTCVGLNSGTALSSGSGYNVLLGHGAGAAMTTGNRNIAIGVSSMDGFDTEAHNLGIGISALGGSVAGGEYNIAIGNYSLDALTSGDYNVAVGYDAGTALTTGFSNVIIGPSTGSAGAISGNDNTCVGEQAGRVLAGGGSNTYIGSKAGVESTSGSNNTCLGHDAGRTGSPGGALVTTGNNICIGDESISACHVQVDWTIASDQRDKTDFTALDLGLDFVNDLKPYTYKWDKRSRYGDKEADDYDLNAQTPDGTHKENWLDIGFKAQEVEALEKAAGYKIADKTNLTTSLSEDGKQYGIKYSNFVPILVKAVQELSAKVKALEDA